METNLGISKDSKLYKLGVKLFKVGFKYFNEYKLTTGNNVPVVWVTNDYGKMIIFVDSMYGSKLLYNAGLINREACNEIHAIMFKE